MAALSGIFSAAQRRPAVYLLAILLALLLEIAPPGKRLEQTLGDWRLRNFSPPSEAIPITVVAIDEEAIDLLGPWPWPRSVMASLLDRIFTRYAPAAVGLDMVFPPGVPDNEDSALARALNGRPVVVGQLFTQDPGERGRASYQTFNTSAGLPQFQGTLASSPRLGVTQAGHINALIDSDGKMRRLWPAVCATAGCSPALAVSLFGLLTGTDGWHIERGRPWQSPWRLAPASARELALPLDENFAAAIPWLPSPPHRYLSAAQIWQGTLPPEALQNHLILIGATAPALGDRVNTPVGTGLPGVETQARLLGAWLAGRTPGPSALSNPLLFALWLAQTALLLGVGQTGKKLAATGLLLALAAGLGNLWLYYAADLMLPLALPVFYPLLFSFAMILAALYADRSWIMNQIGSYLPAPLVRHLQDHTPDPSEETSWTTVMYADIIGSTAVSRHMNAEDLAHWSNRAVDLVAEEVTLRGGIIDNVAGDGLMVYWRDAPPAEQARQALESALAIRDGLERLNARQQADWPPLRMGLGIHAGLLLAGSFGQARRRYTILGEVANLAFRIERQARKLPAQQLISAAVAEQKHDIPLYRVETVDLDGSDEPVPLFSFADKAVTPAQANLQDTGTQGESRPAPGKPEAQTPATGTRPVDVAPADDL